MVISGSVDGFARFHSRPMTGLVMRYEFPHSDSLLLVCQCHLIETPDLIRVGRGTCRIRSCSHLQYIYSLKKARTEPYDLECRSTVRLAGVCTVLQTLSARRKTQPSMPTQFYTGHGSISRIGTEERWYTNRTLAHTGVWIRTISQTHSYICRPGACHCIHCFVQRTRACTCLVHWTE